MSYKQKVLEKMIGKTPGIYHINVEHNNWCGIFKGGECNCKPKIR